MIMLEFASILLFILIVLNLVNLLKKNSQTIDTNTISNDILAKLAHNQAQTVAQLINEISKLSQNQETRFHELQVKLLAEVSSLKEQNQQSLVNILNQIRDQLSKSVSELNQRNKENFELLSSANQERLRQLELEISKRLDENLAQNLRSFENVTKNLSQIETRAQQMLESTKAIDRLNSIFDRTSVKAFGNFGESYLETLLAQHLAPTSWQKQVKLTNTDYLLDFVITIGDLDTSKKIGIDCKFPLTKYQDFIESDLTNKKAKFTEFLQTVKKMAIDISQKYALHQTVDLMIMFFPSEGIYNEVVNHDETLKFLQTNKIQPASPSTIFALIMLLKSQQYKLHINQNAQLIIDGLKVVRKNVEAFREEFRKLGDKLRQAQANYDLADRSLLNVQNEVLKLENTNPKS
jgi:DNA recombination protein RmuC